MHNTEIDAIFASKAKPTQVEPTSLSFKAKGKAKADPSPSSTGKKNSKKNKKSTRGTETSKATPQDTATPATASKRKYPEPETILDPSASAVTTKGKKAARPSGAEEVSDRATKKKKVVDREGNDKFRDSRGQGPRRKTEDGYSIYKEDELGIGDKGGDTPLCPFDCECCF